MSATATRRALILSALEGDAFALSVLADVLAFSGCDAAALAVREGKISVRRRKHGEGKGNRVVVFAGESAICGGG